MTPPELTAGKVRLTVIREPACTPMTPRKRQVCWDFGIPPREEPKPLVEDLELDLRPGRLILLTGPSGSGKSSLLNAIADHLAESPRKRTPIWVGRERFPAGRPIVDAVASCRPLPNALEILTACGLGEPRLWIRQFHDLSDGERFRAHLARAIGKAIGHAASSSEPSAGEHARSPRHPERISCHPERSEGSPPSRYEPPFAPIQPIFCDEFTAILHRRLAKAVAYNLRKLVTRMNLLLIVATTHEDIAEDLQPDTLIRLNESALPTVTHHRPADQAISLQVQVNIEPGEVKDYRLFSPMHYRHRDGLGFADKVFLLREKTNGDPLGILVFAHAPLELALRNQATIGRFRRKPRLLNQELRILRRLVMRPDIRGCGLGHWFVQQALPRVGVRFIECLAAMGAVNPVFEKAGMTRVGRCPLPRGRLALLERMKKWHVDPFAADFPRRISRCPRVRKLVESTVQDWVNTTHGRTRYLVAGRPTADLARTFRQLLGQPPMYYLWDREGEYPHHGDNPALNQPPTGSRLDPAIQPRRSCRSTDRHDPHGQRQ